MTCGNLLCGCLGIVAVFDGNLPAASWLILVAGILDFGDGFVARLVKAHSELGKQLDSLADMVTFGALPAFMMFKLLASATASDVNSSAFIYADGLPYLAFSLAIFSALRLAKFNIDTRQSDSFIGVPTPANALVIASFPLMMVFRGGLTDAWGVDLFCNSPFWIGYTILMSYLMVAELPLMAFKFKSFTWAENKIKYIFLILSALLLLILQFAAIPVIVGLYVLLSLSERVKERKSQD